MISNPCCFLHVITLLGGFVLFGTLKPLINVLNNKIIILMKRKGTIEVNLSNKNTIARNPKSVDKLYLETMPNFFSVIRRHRIQSKTHKRYIRVKRVNGLVLDQ